MIFDKGAKICNWERKPSSINGVWKIESHKQNKQKLDYNLAPYTKINSKWIKDIRSETIEENIGTKFIDLGLREDFENWPQKQRKWRQK